MLATRLRRFDQTEGIDTCVIYRTHVVLPGVAPEKAHGDLTYYMLEY